MGEPEHGPVGSQKKPQEVLSDKYGYGVVLGTETIRKEKDEKQRGRRGWAIPAAPMRRWAGMTQIPTVLLLLSLTSHM